MKTVEPYEVIKSELETALLEDVANEISSEDIYQYVLKNIERFNLMEIDFLHRKLVYFFKENYKDKFITLN